MTPVAIERLRRMTDVWRASEPSALDVALARQRFELGRRRSPRPSPFLLLGWGALGALAGVTAMLLLGSVSPSPAAIEAERGAPALAAEPTAAADSPPTSEPAGVAPPHPTARPAPPQPRPHVAAPPGPSAPATPAGEIEAPRDTAALKRAERWIAIGRGSRAMPIVVGLEADGSAPDPTQRDPEPRPPAPKPE